MREIPRRHFLSLYSINCRVASSPSEKESLVTPIVESLSANEEYSSSRALSHALTIRADARLDCFPPIAEGALEDSRRATAINPLNGRAWRVWQTPRKLTGTLRARSKPLLDGEKWIRHLPPRQRMRLPGYQKRRKIAILGFFSRRKFYHQ